MVHASPYPSPILEPVSDFSYLYQGDSIYCGPQTISIVDQALTEGVLADFISISRISGSWTLTVRPTNIDQAGKTYFLELVVHLDSFPNSQ